jgi:hypothetical protein
MDIDNLDLTRERFYVVLEKFYDKVNDSMRIKIQCECGNIVEKGSSHLISCKTCGHGCPISTAIRSANGKVKMANKKLLDPGVSGLKRLFGVYKTRAKKFNYAFEIDLDVFKELTSSNCYYCDEPPAMVYQHQILTVSDRSRLNSQYIYNSLDRVDSDKGYTLDNVRPCCKLCNTMKMHHPEEEFKNKIRILYSTYINKHSEGDENEEHF